MTEFDPESLRPEDRLQIDDVEVLEAFNSVMEQTRQERPTDVEQLHFSLNDYLHTITPCLPKHIANYLSLNEEVKSVESLDIIFDTGSARSRCDLRIEIAIRDEQQPETIVLSRQANDQVAAPFNCELIHDNETLPQPHAPYPPAEINRLLASLIFPHKNARDLGRFDVLDPQSPDSATLFKEALSSRADEIIGREFYIFDTDDEEVIYIERQFNSLDDSETYTLIETLQSDMAHDDGELVSQQLERHSQIASSEEGAEVNSLDVHLVDTRTPLHGPTTTQSTPLEVTHDLYVSIMRTLRGLGIPDEEGSIESYEQHKLRDEEAQRRAANRDTDKTDDDTSNQ